MYINMTECMESLPVDVLNHFCIHSYIYVKIKHSGTLKENQCRYSRNISEPNTERRKQSMRSQSIRKTVQSRDVPFKIHSIKHIVMKQK